MTFYGKKKKNFKKARNIKQFLRGKISGRTKTLI